MSDDVMTIKEAAEYLRISPSTLHRLAKKGEIGQKVGGRYRFLKADLDNMLQSKARNNRTRELIRDMNAISQNLERLQREMEGLKGNAS